ncbi:MAG: hypothetical protein RMN25_13340 [Anaerolineae bacterium]|nr:hypothetical protein [Thermoflexales bacterium]MDW8408758.1 hypothetical protein [Anaerolineae bacterium]
MKHEQRAATSRPAHGKIGERLAWLVSNLLSPPIVGLLGAGIVTIHEPQTYVPAGETNRWLLFGVYALTAIVLPTGLVFAMTAIGRIGDVNMNLREERLIPYLFAVLCMAIGSIIMAAASAPRGLFALSSATCLLYVLLTVISLRSKVSAHSAGMGLFSVMGIVTIGGPLLATVPLTVALMWARVHMRRHTWAQTIAGVLLGGASFLVVWLIVAGNERALAALP